MFTKILHILFSVKTDITGLQVQTVKIGNNVTMKCDQIIDNNKDNIDLNVAWYKQSLGNVPKLIVRLMGSKKNMRFSTDFTAGPIKFDKDTFDLSINETKERGFMLQIIYCGKISKSGVVEFESGTRLIVEGTDFFVYILIISDNNRWIVLALTLSNIISVVVIIVLVGVLLRVLSFKADDTDAVNYVALNFAKRPPPSRTPRVQESQDIYSRVKHS
uniref:Immunoglobulin V-set domain-containing protein n=1 Tax=Astyanax mexicanus TaxID=7994 RepID=A0A3B1K4M2_ASTMX